MDFYEICRPIASFMKTGRLQCAVHEDCVCFCGRAERQIVHGLLGLECFGQKQS